VQHEPVIITKQNRPVAITLSIQQAERLFQGQVEAGIASGLEDVATGRFVEMTTSHLEVLRARFQAGIR
jgi:predicted transcriptional regulator